jgi:hypothetical protein
MRVAVTIQHPAHVHFFRPIRRLLLADGHEISIFVRAKDVALDLLDSYGIPYTVVTTDGSDRPVTNQLRYEYRLLGHLRRGRPDVVTAIGGLGAAHASALTDLRSVVFTDSEHRSNWLMAPFADVICTPHHFGMSFGARHRRYDGFHELAYLHPDRFEPDPAALRSRGVDPDGPYSVVRFSGMDAHHDRGATGFSAAAKRDLRSLLSRHGSTFVVNEGAAPCSAPVPPHLFHHLLAHADLVVTDAATTAAEAALLATPTVRSTSFASERDMQNFVELGDHGLVYSTADEGDALERCRQLLADETESDRWLARRDALLAETTDVAEFAAAVIATVGRSRRLDTSVEVSADV